MMQHAVARAVMLLAGLATLGLAGCTSSSFEDGPPSLMASNSTLEVETEKPAGSAMIGKPYKAAGRWFTPQEDPSYDETGKASWYGSELHGRRTANGERFDAEALTAAHPTLPLPSYIRVTNMKSGRQAVLRLNDRGPFARDRLIDVSRGAAEKLDFRRTGHADVRVEYLGPAPLDGGDTETLVAEAKFGVSNGSAVAEGEGRSLRDFIPFGRRKAKEEEGTVDVRLASITREEARTPRGEPLPGVRVPMAFINDPEPVQSAAPRKPGEPAAVEMASLSAAERAQAYQDSDTATLDSLLTAEGEASAPVEMSAPVAVTPVAVVAPAYDVAPEISAEPLAEASAAPVKSAAATTKAAASPAAPLAVAPAENASSRIGGAYDLFAAIDDSVGGAGKMHGVGQ